jgi:hypothetical protein
MHWLGNVLSPLFWVLEHAGHMLERHVTPALILMTTEDIVVMIQHRGTTAMPFVAFG